MLNNAKGFTLMEILVVVTIIGILAAIAVPSYIYAVDKGRKDACAANVQTIATQVERYKLERGKEVGNQEDIVAFLQEEGYLTNMTVQCPYGLIPERAQEYEGGIVYTYEEGRVRCSHCSKDE